MSDVNCYQMLGYLAERGQVINQIESYNSLWNNFVDNVQQNALLRDLRINLRQLRSVMLLLAPLLPPEGEEWRELLKARYIQLGDIREYDVAYQACIKYETHTEELVIDDYDVCPELPILKELLKKEYDERVNFWVKDIEKDCIAREMQACKELLNKTNALSIEQEAEANAFLQSRLQLWGFKLYNKLQEMNTINSVAQFHKLRVKVKRFRYAYGVFMQEAVNAELLESLKDVQDILGSLHDSDRDVELIEHLVCDRIDDLALQRELACFKAWRQLKIQQRMEQLPIAQQRVLNAMKQDIVGVNLL